MHQILKEENIQNSTLYNDLKMEDNIVIAVFRLGFKGYCCESDIQGHFCSFKWVKPPPLNLND